MSTDFQTQVNEARLALASTSHDDFGALLVEAIIVSAGVAAKRLSFRQRATAILGW
jgi:hypothetical protein